MSKKNFKDTGADLFLSDDVPKTSTQATEDLLDTIDTQTQIKSTKKEYYRLNLKLDMKLKEYVAEAAWRKRMTVTEYVNTLLRADRDKANDEQTQ